MHVVLSTRMLLHLRSIANRDFDGELGGKAWGAAYNSVGREYSTGNGPSQVSTIRFAEDGWTMNSLEAKGNQDSR